MSFTFKYSPVTNLGNIGNENLRKFRGEKIRDFLTLHFVHESGAFLYHIYIFFLSPVLKGLCTSYSFEYSIYWLTNWDFISNMMHCGPQLIKYWPLFPSYAKSPDNIFNLSWNYSSQHLILEWLIHDTVLGFHPIPPWSIVLGLQDLIFGNIPHHHTVHKTNCCWNCGDFNQLWWSLPPPSHSILIGFSEICGIEDFAGFELR
jgi:hypothetical protein